MNSEQGGVTAGRAIRPAVLAVTTKKQLDKLVSFYLKQDGFAFDVETQGDDRLHTPTNDVAWISLATNGRADVIPMGHRNGDLKEYRANLLKSGRDRLASGKEIRLSDLSKDRQPVFFDPPEQLSRSYVFSKLEPLFSSTKLDKVAHNAKFDCASIEKYLGFLPEAPVWDTLVAETIIDSRLKHQKLSLKETALRRIGFVMEKGVGVDITKHSFDEVAVYSYLDAKVTWLIWKAQKERLDQLNMWGVFEMEMGVQRAIIEMQSTGTRIDQASMLVLKAQVEKELDEARERVFKAAGHEFNLKSSADKVNVLFVEQKLKPVSFTEKTKTPSTDAKHLSNFPNNAVARGLLEVSEKEKILSTYLIPYLGGEVSLVVAGKPKVVVRDSLLVNGRVHTAFNQTGTETGRMSSSSPNLQNIPSRGSYGKQIRDLFVADPGHTLVVGDYSQIEPRIIASFSGDAVMLRAYRSGGDLYQAIADELGITRAAGKELVLSMAYGVGPDKLAERIDGVSVTRAKELLKEFDSKFQSVPRLKAAVISRAKSRRPPWVATISGRRRYIPELMSRDHSVYSSGERKAFNTLIQGSAADVMKTAIVRAYEIIPDEAKLLLTVHDELVVQTPDELVEETVACLTEAMEGVSSPAIKVPLKVDIGTGKSWGSAKG